MKFYYIWAKLFSFESKNTYKIDIRNMSHKNAIKMINIQKSYSVHFVLFNPHWFCLVYVGPIGSIRSTLILFYPLMSYSVHIGYIQSIHLFLFSPYVHLGPNLSIHSYSILLGPSCFHLVLFCPFGTLRSI